MITTQQQEQLKAIYNKYFNNSKIEFSRACIGENTTFVNLYLAENEKECSNGIMQNDIFSILFEITDFDKNIFEIKSVQNYYKIKPKFDYLFCDYQKISFRKVQGNFDKIATTFENFVKKLDTQLKADYNTNNLLDRDLQLAKYKLNFNIK